MSRRTRAASMMNSHGRGFFAAVLTLAALTASGVQAQPCDEWTVTDNPVYNDVEYRPTMIAAFAPDSALAFRVLAGVGLVPATWDGSTWTASAPVPLNVPSPATLGGLTGSAPDAVWATGAYTVDPTTQWPYLARFTGQGWESIEGSLLDWLDPNGGESVARSGGGSEIAVIAPDDIWVVGLGDATNGGPPGAIVQPIAMHWNGSSFEEYEPQVQPVYNSLNSVEAIDAAASDAVWFVGSGRNLGSSDSHLHFFIYYYDGSTWTPQLDWIQLPGSDSVSEDLFDVVAFAPDDVWAFGQKLTLADGTASLYLHWDGASWTEVAGPDIGPITSAEAGGSSEIWASCAFGEYQGVLAHWDGTEWTAEQSAFIPDATHIGLTNLAASPHGDVWAVGSWGIYDGMGGWEVYEDILEHYTPCTVSGDTDGDGDVDLFDCAVLFDCVTGPEQPTLPGCEAADMDFDGDVDFHDFSVFQLEYTQP